MEGSCTIIISLFKQKNSFMKIYSDQVTKTQNLITGLKNKIELVKNKGINEEFISHLEADNKLIASYNDEIDKFKAAIKEKSREANRKLLEVKIRIKGAKKIVKQNFNSENWKEFGINDKR